MVKHELSIVGSASAAVPVLPVTRDEFDRTNLPTGSAADAYTSVGPGTSRKTPERWSQETATTVARSLRARRNHDALDLPRTPSPLPLPPPHTLLLEFSDNRQGYLVMPPTPPPLSATRPRNHVPAGLLGEERGGHPAGRWRSVITALGAKVRS